MGGALDGRTSTFSDSADVIVGSAIDGASSVPAAIDSTPTGISTVPMDARRLSASLSAAAACVQPLGEEVPSEGSVAMIGGNPGGKTIGGTTPAEHPVGWPCCCG